MIILDINKILISFNIILLEIKKTILESICFEFVAVVADFPVISRTKLEKLMIRR